jgi:hypothetical protein
MTMGDKKPPMESSTHMLLPQGALREVMTYAETRRRIMKP